MVILASPHVATCAVQCDRQTLGHPRQSWGERFGKVFVLPILPARGCVISRRLSPPWHCPCVAQYLQSQGHPVGAEIIHLSDGSRQPRTGDDCPRSIIQNKAGTFIWVSGPYHGCSYLCSPY